METNNKLLTKEQNMKNSLKPTHRILLNANPTHGYMVCSRYIENKTPVWRIEIIKRDKTSLRSFKGLWLEIVGNNTTPVALGGSAAEVLDLLDQAFTALSTQTAAGFGAVTSTVGDFAQLAAKIKTIKGSL
jgi:hypothetical protein